MAKANLHFSKLLTNRETCVDSKMDGFFQIFPSFCAEVEEVPDDKQLAASSLIWRHEQTYITGSVIDQSDFVLPCSYHSPLKQVYPITQLHPSFANKSYLDSKKSISEFFLYF